MSIGDRREDPSWLGYKEYLSVRNWGSLFSMIFGPLPFATMSVRCGHNQKYQFKMFLFGSSSYCVTEVPVVLLGELWSAGRSGAWPGVRKLEGQGGGTRGGGRPPPVLLGWGNPSPLALSTDSLGVVLNILQGGGGGHIFQREPNESQKLAPQKCGPTRGHTQRQAPVEAGLANPLLGMGCSACPPPPGPEAAPWGWPPGPAHLEGVEEVPEGPGVDDIVVRGQEEGHHHAGQACEEGEGH